MIKTHGERDEVRPRENSQYQRPAAAARQLTSMQRIQEQQRTQCAGCSNATGTGPVPGSSTHQRYLEHPRATAMACRPPLLGHKIKAPPLIQA